MPDGSSSRPFSSTRGPVPHYMGVRSIGQLWTESLPPVSDVFTIEIYVQSLLKGRAGKIAGRLWGRGGVSSGAGRPCSPVLCLPLAPLLPLPAVAEASLPASFPAVSVTPHSSPSQSMTHTSILQLLPCPYPKFLPCLLSLFYVVSYRSFHSDAPISITIFHALISSSVPLLQLCYQQ